MLNSLIGIIASSGGAAGGGNSYESIATINVGGGGSSSITFSSIPSTYQHLQVRWMCLNSNAQTDLKFQLNGDSSSVYAFHQLYGDGSSAGAGALTTQTRGFTGTGGSSTVAGVGVLDVLDYTSTTKNKTARALSGVDANGSGFISVRSNLYFPTSITAVTSLTIAPDAGTFSQYSSFALYGLKG
jgi:hypothetical protein